MSRPLDRRLGALARAVELADGRLEPERVEAARRVVQRAGIRLGLGVESTVVALAGPTGAGKSTLFNALAGAELSRPGVRRPTTSSITAAVAGSGHDGLLDWLEAGTRHVLGDGAVPDGMVLLDLPDYDSVETSHRAEVERVIELVDLMVWVVDPQKYADSALHDRYLRPLAGHGEAMAVVLNQSDRLSPAALDACRADLARLLAEDGLRGLPVVAVSAADGSGLEHLRELLRRRAEARAAAVARLEADVAVVAARLDAGCDGPSREDVGRRERAQLAAALADAAGVRLVTSAVARAHRRSGSLAAGWPPARWLARLRPDPLRRLRLGPGASADVRTSLPRPTPVQQSQVASAVRMLAAGVARDMPDPWPGLARRAVTASEEVLPERLDRAVAGAQLPNRRPLWWSVAGLLQRALALAAGAGALWLLALVALGYLRLEDAVPLPEVEGIPLPTLMLLGGLAGGLLLAVLARWVNGIAAARRARAAERTLRRHVEDVAAELVVEPLRAELALRDELCRALQGARG